MSPRPPVVARFVPPRRVVGVVARFALWPLAFVGARALAADAENRVAFGLILASLLASSISGAPRHAIARAAVVASGLVVAVPSFAAARAAFAAMHAHPALAVVGAAVVAIGAAASFARTLSLVRPHVDAPLDADALSLVPAAAWLALAALLVRWGGEAVHLHVIVATLSRALAAIAVVLAAIAAVTLRGQLGWTRRAFRGEELTVVPLPGGVAPGSIPWLASVGGESVIAPAQARFEPYRSDHPPIARVPSSPDALVRLYRTQGRAAVSLVGVAATTTALVVGSCARVAHPRDAAVATALPPLPGACTKVRPLVRLVPLAPLRLVDLESIAARYRRLGVADVRIESPLPFEPTFLDAARQQIVGEWVLAAAQRVHRAQSARELVVVVTDRDMYLSGADWRFAFAVRHGGTSVLSLARMDPSFPWLSPKGYEPRAPDCEEVLLERAYKMITRALLQEVCQVGPSSDRRSVRRQSVAGLADLDAMEEARF